MLLKLLKVHLWDNFMASLKDIKNRILSIQSTMKITRAMKMVAAAKVKKAETNVKNARPYSANVSLMLEKMLETIDDIRYVDNTEISNPIENYPGIIAQRPVKSVGLLVLTSNKGLAGAYNSNIVKQTINRINTYKCNNVSVKLYVAGQKGEAGLKKKISKYGLKIEKTYYNIIDKPDITSTYYVIEELANLYIKGEIDKIEIITTKFRNMMSYSVEQWQILPIKKKQEQQNNYSRVMEFEPDKETILAKIVPMYLTGIVHQAILEAQASELASRMTAMSAASNNAEKILKELSVEYNKIRQAAITNEIVEVVSGANAQIG